MSRVAKAKAHLIGGPLCGSPVELEKAVTDPPERIEFPDGLYLLAHTKPPWMQQWIPGHTYYIWEGLFAGAL